MRNALLVTTATGLLLAANVVVPEPRDVSMAVAPPQTATLLLASLGRREVAADLAWLRLVQLTGDVRYVGARYPAIEDWISLIADLHPRLFGPFYFGVTLLLGDPTRREKVDELLRVAEERAPNEFRFSLERGVIAYFGRFDALAAADHFDRAAKKPDAPRFLGTFAATLRKRGIMCATVAADAAAIAQGVAPLGDRTLECVKRRIEAAAAAARLNEDPDDSVDVLVERGHLPADTLVPGVCWELSAGTATPRRCPKDR